MGFGVIRRLRLLLMYAIGTKEIRSLKIKKKFIKCTKSKGELSLSHEKKEAKIFLQIGLWYATGRCHFSPTCESLFALWG